MFPCIQLGSGLVFISIDGGDGTGKSTQVALLAEWLRGRDQEVLTCRDPGSTALGEQLRRIVLDRDDLAIDRRSEMLLYMAARAQLVAEVIRPALAAGKWVLSDRYLLANVVYQGHAGGLDVDCLWEVGRVATGGLSPGLTIVLDLPAEEAARRIGGKPDRMERAGVGFHQRVRQGFLAEARRHPDRIVVIDARPPIAEVHGTIRRLIQQRMADGPGP